MSRGYSQRVEQSENAVPLTLSMITIPILQPCSIGQSLYFFVVQSRGAAITSTTYQPGYLNELLALTMHISVVQSVERAHKDEAPVFPLKRSNGGLIDLKTCRKS